VQQESTSAKRPGQCCNSAQDGASVHHEGEGGDKGNTPPQNSQKTLEPQGKAAVDWLKVACYGDWDVRRWGSVLGAIEAARLKSQKEGQVGTIDGPDGGLIVVKASRTKPKGGMGSCWLLEYEGISFAVADRPSAHETVANLVVDVPGLVLMRLGHLEAWAVVRRVLAGLGFELQRTVVSRIDLAADVFFKIARFVELLNAGKFVKRAKKISPIGDDWGKWQGVYVGLKQAPLKLRLYNKLVELWENGADEEKWDLLSERWGGKPDEVTRAEFEFEREFLRERSLDAVEDVFAALGSLAEYACREWFRFTLEVPDKLNGHSSRTSELHPLWAKVLNAFQESFKQEVVELERRPWKAPKAKALRAMVFGGLTSLAAVVGKSCTTARELGEWAARMIEGAGEDLVDVLDSKLIEFQSHGPGRGLAWADDIPF
jgi:hypothetical protein